MTAIQNHSHQYGCALYMRQTTHITYVKRQNHIEHMDDMLNSTMRKANVVRRHMIGAYVQNNAKNVRPRIKGKRHFDDILYIKIFMLASSNVKVKLNNCKRGRIYLNLP